MEDMIVIGGSYAGMAAALQLVRARRRVAVIDARVRRNRFASHSHGFLGQDGVDPAQLWAEAQRQLLAYPTLPWSTASPALSRAIAMRSGSAAGEKHVYSSPWVRGVLGSGA
jgi:thioredoxin reductase